MAASKEWTEWHLTPDGWITGDKKRDNGFFAGKTPPDRVKTVCYIEICNGSGPPSGEVNERWEYKDESLVQMLLDRYGAAPARL